MERLTKKEQNFINKKNSYKFFDHSQMFTNFEIILDVLKDNKDKWYFAYELMGNHPLGFIGYEVSARLSELFKEGKVERRKIDRFYAYSYKSVKK